MKKMILKTKLASQLAKAVLPFSFFLYVTSAYAEEATMRAGEYEMLKIEQQKKVRVTVSGVVYDGNTKEPIIGGSVAVKEQGKGTVTNIDGEFKLDCNVGDILVISYIGYEAKEITVTNLKVYSIELYESTAQLGEVVVTAFGAGQKKASMVGSVEQIKPAELQVPSSSLSSAFAGRMAGVIAVQRSGEPGADGASFWIRGKSTFSGATAVSYTHLTLPTN